MSTVSADGARSGATTSASASSGPASSLFTGPWALEFDEALSSAEDPTSKDILSDGLITADELTRVEQEFAACALTLGFEVRAFTPGGGYTQDGAPESFDPSDPGEEFLACSGSYESVSPLFWSIARNPAHEPEQSIMAACLVDRGLAPEGYSSKDFDRDRRSGAYPFSKNDAIFLDCAADPLGLLPNTARSERGPGL
ncbi:hypothetical protein [Okibacterium fritillariae]|uniref:Uncharacterized protein n=1 Tax=Okibacterium fritillariae TaxID=123320 RepID=A0A1T5KE80_9MICO|nr:hypothetical protein [Okibacterium fritillariae]SKC62003.1 hypothetical protein SAMN06309945_2153 [Okibacterium fritillariae]